MAWKTRQNLEPSIRRRCGLPGGIRKDANQGGIPARSRRGRRIQLGGDVADIRSVSTSRRQARFLNRVPEVLEGFAPVVAAPVAAER